MNLAHAHRLVLIVGIGAALACTANAAPITLSSAGLNAADIQATVDAFRVQLGGDNNGNTPGSQPDGRREINWDGGGAGATATFFPTPMTTFSNRGDVNITPGAGFEISGQPLPEFGDINPSYPDIFTTFSSPRLFAPLGSNVMDVFFTVPGTTDVLATTTGFGAVFTDVDLIGVTSLAFLDSLGNVIDEFFVPTFNDGLSFLGVYYGEPIVARVRITLGNAALGPNDGGGIDVVALDDFIYGEPQALQGVPEPGTLTLLAIALAGLAFRRRKRR
jgi:hypothetical protein